MQHFFFKKITKRSIFFIYWTFLREDMDLCFLIFQFNFYFCGAKVVVIMRLTITLILLFCFTSFTEALAQRNYPVRATVQYAPPYSLFLGDLATPKVVVTLTGQDLLDANCPYKLSISLECQNVKVATKPTFNPAPLYISGGQTIVLTGADLAQYFDIHNLDFHGITAAKYLQDGQLPEGFYRMNVKVIHYRENRQISNTAFAMFNARMGKPPVLTLPKDKSLIPPSQQATPITFSWTPKTVGSFQYLFELWECAVPGIPVQTVVSTVRPLHTHTLTSPMYTFHPSTENMKPGMEYAWRVTVTDPIGQQKFANSGQSEIHTFTYKRKPEPVAGLRYTNKGLRINWTWDMDPAHTKYYFEYYDPQTGRTLDPVECDYAGFTINMPSTGYHLKARVRAECYGDPTLMSDYTPYLDTYLEPIPVPEYECGKQFPDREITNLELKHTLSPGEIVESKNGDTRYEIIYSEEKNGYLSGQFYMIMDCWGGAKIRCEFSKTQVNTDNIVLKTIFRNVPDSTLYVKPETIRKEIQEAYIDAATVLTDFSIKDTVKLDKPYTYLYVNDSGKVMAVIDDKGKIKTEETAISAADLKENTLVQGKNGEELVITKKGQVMGKEEFNATGGNGVLLKDYHRKSDSLAQWQINFTEYDRQTYAFDRIGSGDHGIFATDEYYPKAGSYDFRYKSVECGKNDKVVVDFGSYPQADSVVFKDKYGVTYPIKDRIITFTGVSKPDTNYIYAYRGDKKIGKLFLNTYQRKTYNVVLVSVNGAKILHEKNVDKAVKKVEESLNKVYNQCAVSFKISHTTISFDDLTSFSHGGSGILTVYNDDQKKVLSAYEKEKKMTDGVYYLFFIDNVTDKKDGSGTPVSGYMPRGYNAGFIYDGGSPHTIAHELGHGIAGLEHVFENSNNSGKTANLMDYASGEELWHFQWDQIQDPSRVWMKWSKDESEGEWTTDGHYYLFTFLGMLMGMNYDEAEVLGKYAEEPDSRVTNAGDMEENITWLIGNLQQRNHALTGGEHGVELAATVYAITHYLTDENKMYLYHRFGDCYAHINNSNDSKGFNTTVRLQSYIDAFEDYLNSTFSFVRANTEQRMSDRKTITIQPNEIIYDNNKYITSIPHDKFIQMLLRKILTADSEGGLESKYKSAFRFYYTTYSGFDSYWQEFVYGDYEYEYSEIVSDLKKYLPQADQNSYEMFGADQEGLIDSWCGVNMGHSLKTLVEIKTPEKEMSIPIIDKKINIPEITIIEKKNPDAIVRRKVLFSLYTRHLYQLLSIIKKIEGSNEEMVCKKIDKIVEWASKKDLKDTRFDGIFAFEIMCLKENIDPIKNAHGKQVLIPIKYLKEDVKNSDLIAKGYYTEESLKNDAIAQYEFLKDYLKEVYYLDCTRSENEKNIIVNIQ